MSVDLIERFNKQKYAFKVLAILEQDDQIAKKVAIDTDESGSYQSLAKLLKDKNV